MTELERLRNPNGLNFDDNATSALSPVFGPKVFNAAPLAKLVEQQAFYLL